jgi:hypothetical protein
MATLILRYGLLGGAIVAAPMLWRMLTVDAQSPGEDPLGGLLVGYLIMLVALTTVFLGIKQYRDKVQGGVIRFLPAFGVGLAITCVASVIYVIAWEISIALSDWDFIAYYSNAMIEGARTRGASAAELAKVTADAQAFVAMYSKPVYRMAMTFIEIFPVGLLVSLISAAVLRNPRVLPARAPAT